MLYTTSSAMAKPPLEAWLNEHCPLNFWENAEQVFDQAIQFVTNMASTNAASGTTAPCHF